MVTDGTERGGWQAADQQDDDLNRAFGPETASVQTRSMGQRARTWLVIGGSTVVVAGVIALVLGTIIGSVQNGIGGVFPRPDLALDRFDRQASDVTGVTEVRQHPATKTGFASYDAIATVTADPSLDAAARSELVADLSRATDSAGGNGVRVVAIADLGNLEVGVTESRSVAEQRLVLADRLDHIGGVTAVRCSWARGGSPSDRAADQAIVVETPGRGAAVPPIVARVTEETHRVFPGASVEVVAAK
ncbi:hypothetical protein [Curtobacterium sp. VKM Ac-1393]|uniref:hypothetical protein n=1 Tax=Curtobacterium sp. VKM Ac-1393 TaxID=2783814 RepID=UPI00188C4061|nr:hypothetical protein [Curtobacterium sp. VKM Ac-1393]MBF4608256.1 hypothetical protein [Curtobacterium sp. VKM Ac-1393]